MCNHLCRTARRPVILSLTLQALLKHNVRILQIGQTQIPKKEFGDDNDNTFQCFRHHCQQAIKILTVVRFER